MTSCSRDDLPIGLRRLVGRVESYRTEGTDALARALDCPLDVEVATDLPGRLDPPVESVPTPVSLVCCR